MSECKRCGSKVKEDMSFCPRCGAPLKAEAVSAEQPTARRARGEKEEKFEKHEKREKGEKHEKREYIFLGWLVAGIILIIVGLMAYFEVTGFMDMRMRAVMWAVFAIVAGLLVILGAFYYMSLARGRHPRP